MGEIQDIECMTSEWYFFEIPLFQIVLLHIFYISYNLITESSFVEPPVTIRLFCNGFHYNALIGLK
jgi:hypothetical protein